MKKDMFAPSELPSGNPTINRPSRGAVAPGAVPEAGETSVKTQTDVTDGSSVRASVQGGAGVLSRPPAKPHE